MAAFPSPPHPELVEGGRGVGGEGTKRHALRAPPVRRALRQHPTRAEDIPWRSLRGSRFNGAKLRRQVPIDRYVIDFHCHAAKLVVKLDGKQYEWFADYDSGLERLGLKVIRFTNEEVCGDLDAVLARIRAELRLPFD
jgi:very-short-patch-repair endonuclease